MANQAWTALKIGHRVGLRLSMRAIGVAAASVAVAVVLAAPAPAAAALRFARTDYTVPGLPNHPSQPQGGGINTVALVDLNKDGRLDIVVADTGTGGVDVFLNQGGGAFTASPGDPFSACNNNFDAQDIVAGQLNPPDQKPDVAVICGSDGTIVRLLGDGAGGLGTPETFFGTSVGIGLKLAHLTGASGDYLFTGPSNVACFIPVTATPGAGAAAAEECDSTHTDGTPLVTAGVPVHWYDGPCFSGDQVLAFSGTGTFVGWGLDPRIGGGGNPGSNSCASPFQASTDRSSGIVSPNNHSAMAAADLNGDGEPDVVIADSGGGIHVVGWQAASTTFAGGIPPTEHPSSFASVARISSLGIADFNRDGCPDIGAAESVDPNDHTENNLMAVHLGHCNTSHFDPARTFDVGGGDALGDGQDPSTAVGDLNGDGRPDVVTVAGYGPAAAVTVLLNTTPVAVTSVVPDAGSTAGGNTVTINGTSFAPGASVRFGSTPSAKVKFVSAGRLKAVVPAHTSGVVAVTVKTANGTSTVSSNDLYAYGPPTVSSFTPASGITGALVTIKGTRFVPGATVRFAAKPSALVTFVSTTQLRAVVPSGAAAGKVSVVTPAGTATSATSFRPTLSITGFSPTSGPHGTVVTINGIGFNSGSKVKLNGSPASVTHVSATQLKATVPAAATTGPVTVTNASAPAGTVRSPANYTVT